LVIVHSFVFLSIMTVGHVFNNSDLHTGSTYFFTVGRDSYISTAQ
jgi:hypothetical protein